MRVVLTAVAMFAAAILGPSGVAAQEATGAGGGGRTFKALLFVAPGSSSEGLRVENLREVWSEGESASKLQARLNASDLEQLQVLTIVPGQETAVVRYKDLTFRISGLYRGAGKDRRYLKVSFDQGGQAAVKEFLAGLDESVLIGYPLVGDAGGSIVAVLVPTG